MIMEWFVFRETKNAFLNRHSFCQECTAMVNQAYEQLVDPVSFSQRSADMAKLAACNKKGKKGSRKSAATAPPPPPPTPLRNNTPMSTAAGSSGSSTVDSEASTVELDDDVEIDDDEQQQQQQQHSTAVACQSQQQQQQNGAGGDGKTTAVGHPDYMEDTSGSWKMSTKKAAAAYYDCRIWSSTVKQVNEKVSQL